MDRTTAPCGDYFPAASAEDWAAFSDGYADLVDDLVDVGNDPASILAGPASDRALRERGGPSRRPQVERPRPLVLAF